MAASLWWRRSLLFPRILKDTGNWSQASPACNQNPAKHGDSARPFPPRGLVITPCGLQHWTLGLGQERKARQALGCKRQEASHGGSITQSKATGSHKTQGQNPSAQDTPPHRAAQTEQGQIQNY